MAATNPASLALVPMPAHVTMGTGTFTLTAATAIRGDARTCSNFPIFRACLAPATGFTLPVTNATVSNCITLAADLSLTRLGREGYRLSVSPAGIRISAVFPIGLFYGMQTLRQLLPPEILSQSLATGVAWTVPCVEIEDSPRFAWRGLHLDVSRHFFDVAFIERYLDLMALHKFNMFHWHLVDDQGWRIEIKKYPRLTELGAWRTGDKSNDWNYNGFTYGCAASNACGGYYTQADIKRIVAYAAQRHISILPEIEMPGHSHCALLAYPELVCTGTKTNVAQHGQDVYCAGSEATFTFLSNVLSEVRQLFPCRFIHVGGDEVNKAFWNDCTRCTQRIKDEKLASPEELQSYFMKRVETMLEAKHRRLIGWDEILDGGLPPNAAVMSWRGVQGGIAAAKQGHDVVMSPNSHCYFDYYQCKDTKNEPRAIGGCITLEQVYSYEPVATELSTNEAKHVLGAQGNVWTEWIQTPGQVEYMAYPRACALAEALWLPREAKDWASFLTRMKAHMKRLEILGVRSRKIEN